MMDQIFPSKYEQVSYDFTCLREESLLRWWELLKYCLPTSFSVNIFQFLGPKYRETYHLILHFSSLLIFTVVWRSWHGVMTLLADAFVALLEINLRWETSLLYCSYLNLIVVSNLGHWSLLCSLQKFCGGTPPLLSPLLVNHPYHWSRMIKDVCLTVGERKYPCRSPSRCLKLVLPQFCQGC